MNRPELAVATLALALSTASLFFAAADRPGAPDPRIDALATALAKLQNGTETTAAAQSGDTWHERWQELEQRLTTIEAARKHVARSAGPATADAEPDPALAAPSATATTEASAARARELGDLIAQINAPSFDWQDSETLGRFFALARDGELLDGRIESLETRVATSPGDTAARLELANVYVARLLLANGPEQALWGSRAEKQWHEVRDMDPDNWESRFRIGNSYAYYPDVLGKTDDAIAMLQEAMEVQERQPQRNEHIQTYLSLARMYERKGDRAAAQRVLTAGLRRHPDEPRLREALTSAGG